MKQMKYYFFHSVPSRTTGNWKRETGTSGKAEAWKRNSSKEAKWRRCSEHVVVFFGYTRPAKWLILDCA